MPLLYLHAESINMPDIKYLFVKLIIHTGNQKHHIVILIFDTLLCNYINNFVSIYIKSVHKIIPDGHLKTHIHTKQTIIVFKSSN